MAKASGIQHKGPAQKRVLDNDVILLREVNFKKLGPGLTDTLRTTHLRAGEPEGDQPWFVDGFVAAEQPRDYNMSVALLNATLGFAIARTDNGEILAQFPVNEYVKAADIANKAKIDMAVNILMGEDDAQLEEIADA